ATSGRRRSAPRRGTSVDLPVPARPVRKRLLPPCSRSRARESSAVSCACAMPLTSGRASHHPGPWRRLDPPARGRPAISLSARERRAYRRGHARLLAVTYGAQDASALARFWAEMLQRDVVPDAGGWLLPGTGSQLGL